MTLQCRTLGAPCFRCLNYMITSTEAYNNLCLTNSDIWAALCGMHQICNTRRIHIEWLVSSLLLWIPFMYWLNTLTRYN